MGANTDRVADRTHRRRLAAKSDPPSALTCAHIAEIDAARVRNCGYLVFATDPSKGVDSTEYQQVYATEARTPNQAIAKRSEERRVGKEGRYRRWPDL